MEKDVFYEQLNVFQGRLSKGDIVIVMGDLKAKVDADNTLLGHMLGKRGFGDRNDNGGRFVDFCNFHRLVIGGEFEDRACYKVSWVLTDRRRTSNQIGHQAVAWQYESYLADQTPDILSNLPANINKHGIAMKNALLSGATQLISKGALHTRKGGFNFLSLNVKFGEQV